VPPPKLLTRTAADDQNMAVMQVSSSLASQCIEGHLSLNRAAGGRTYRQTAQSCQKKPSVWQQLQFPFWFVWYTGLTAKLLVQCGAWKKHICFCSHTQNMQSPENSVRRLLRAPCLSAPLIRSDCDFSSLAKMCEALLGGFCDALKLWEVMR